MHFFKLNAWLCEDCSQSYNSTDNYANVLWINRKTAVVENTFSNLNAIVSIKIEKTACSFFLHFWIKLLNKRWDEQKKNLWQMDEKIKNEMSYSKIQWKIHTKKRTSVDKTNRLFGSEDSHSFDAIYFPAWIILRFSLRNTKLDNKSHNYEIKPYYNIFMYWLSVSKTKIDTNSIEIGDFFYEKHLWCRIIWQLSVVIVWIIFFSPKTN